MPNVLDSSAEDLIEMVREHLSTYDITDPNHMNGSVLKHIWTSITKKLDIKGISGKL